MLSKIFGWYWNTATLPLKLAIGVAALVVFGLLFASVKSCWTPKPDLHVNEDDLRGVNSRNAAERTKALQGVVEKNAETIRAVNEDVALAETNVVERNRKVDEAVKEADRKVQEARRSLGRDLKQEEVDCLLLNTCSPPSP